MFVARAKLDAAILSELKRRVAELRGRSREELVELPEWRSEKTTVLGKVVTYTVYRHHQPDGTLMILVRSDKPIFFGIGTAGTTNGFFVLPNGARRDACGDEIADYFG